MTTSSRASSPAATLAVLALASFLAQLDIWITNVGLPAIGDGVGAPSLSDLSWVLNGYGIVYAALLVPAGRLADRYGRKAGFVGGLVVFGVASLGAALSGGVWELVGFRVLQAVGAALLTPSSLGLVLATAPAEKTERYVKIWIAAGSLAAASGPALGGLLVTLSWEWLFLVNLPVVAVATLAALRVVPNIRDDDGGRLPDLAGGAVLIAAIGALNLGVVEGPDWGWGSPRVIAAFAVAIAGLIAFVARSRTHAAPVVDLTLFRDRVFTAANLVALLSFGSFGITLLSSILWMQGHWDYSAIRTGLATAPGPVTFVIGSVVAETLQKRGVRAGTIAGFGSALAAAGAFLFAVLLTEQADYVGAFLPAWLPVGLGLGLAAPISISLATADLPPAQAATGSAVVSMMLTIGSAIGVSILVAILGVASAEAPLSAFQHAWYVAGGIAVATIAAAVLVTPSRAPARAAEAVA